MESVIYNIRKMNKATTLEVHPGVWETAQIIWIRKALGNEVYEVSVYYTKQGGYHTWYAVIVDSQFIFLSIAQYQTDITMAIDDEIWMQSELERIEERDRQGTL